MQCNHLSEYYRLYYSEAMGAKTLPQENLARNIKFLMAKHGHSVPELAAKLKGRVSRSTLHYILNCEKIARIDTAEQIANVYGLSGWHLISPTLQEDLENSPTLSALVSNYMTASEEGKHHIEQVAEREAAYVSKPAQ